jgi:hypothetical protein
MNFIWNKKGVFLLFLGCFVHLHLLFGQHIIPIQNGAKGLYALSKNDTLITPFVFTEVGPFTENCAFANKGEWYAYIDTNGNALTPCMFETVTAFKNGYAIAGDTLGIGLINCEFKVVVPFVFLRVILQKNEYVAVQDTLEKWGVYHILGKSILPCAYDLPPQRVNDQYFIVVKNNLYGVVNDKNELVHPFQYQYIATDGSAFFQYEKIKLF